MEASKQIETYKSQAEMLSKQRTWISTMATQVSVEEQRDQCLVLAERLTKKIESLYERIANLSCAIEAEQKASEDAAEARREAAGSRRCRVSRRSRHAQSEFRT